MKAVKVILAVAAVLAVLQLGSVQQVRAAECTTSSYCNCPCGELCYGPQNCSCVAQQCDTTTKCAPFSCADCSESGKTWNYDMYGNKTSCSGCNDTGCKTFSTDCHLITNTYECPYYVNPCINICGSTPAPTPTSTPPPTCGNGSCGAGEDCSNCSTDCGACPTATPTPPPPPVTCGNGVCNPGESCSNCSSDCGTCPPPPPPATCGDGGCGPGESCANCPADCGACPPPSCNPDLWGAWSSCSGSPASKSRTNECGTVETAYCYGTITSRAVVVSASNTLCPTVRASTDGINGTVHQFSAGSASQPAPQTQSGASYITFSNIVGGRYTISPTVPAGYVLANPCWSKSTGPSGSGRDQSLSVPTDGETLTWDIGYTLGTPWVQAGGGNVYAAGTITSFIADFSSPRSFILDGDGGSPGVALYGTTYDFDVSGLSRGEPLVSTTDWLVNQTAPRPVDWYEWYWVKLGGSSVPSTLAEMGSSQYFMGKPPSRLTPYYIVGDMTTEGDWVVGDGETIIFLVNGNLTIGGHVNITGSGFVAFIAKGDITVSSSVGGLSTSSAPVIEGVYVTSPTGSFATGTSTVAGKERLVLQGIFMAGSFTLQRDLDSVDANTATSSELFLYNPALLFTMPRSMNNVPIIWEEVAP